MNKNTKSYKLEYDTHNMSVLYLTYQGITYELTSYPYEPCLYIKHGDAHVCTLHTAFNTDELIEAFSKGRTVRAMNGINYDEKTFCKILVASIDSKRGDMDFTYAAKLLITN